MPETSRSVAHKVLCSIFKNGQSLSHVEITEYRLEPRDWAFAMELVYGVLRWRWRLEFFLENLMQKPLRTKDRDIHALLLLGLYELDMMSTPDYASVNEVVNLVPKTKRSWAKGLINGVLRSFTRENKALKNKTAKKDSALYSHPEWLISVVKADWPDHWQSILEANNQRPPMWLRVNQQKNNTIEYQQKLEHNHIACKASEIVTGAIKLETAMDVNQLPDFEQGAASVQDIGAQLAAILLDAQPNDRVLDLCAAPGGKACHILERQPELGHMVLVDISESRMQRVQQNLDRIKLYAQCIVADAGNSEDWWDSVPYHKILLDVPCSATGVIRRHPDIKTLRQPDDIDGLLSAQRTILNNAWQCLAPGGSMLYVTCSILRRENDLQIEAFLSEHTDAYVQPIEIDSMAASQYGIQLLPGEETDGLNSDGYYFALLAKRAHD